MKPNKILHSLQIILPKSKQRKKEQAEEIGKEVIDKIGYADLIRLGLEIGFIEKQERPSTSSSKIEIQPVSLGYETGVVYVLSRWAAASGATTMLDSPLLGPSDIAAAGILVVGIFDVCILEEDILKK